MGIYVFNRDLIRELLDNPLSDFGKNIIPHAINTQPVFSYVFQGYWADIGTIRSFFEANLDLVSELPRFNFFDMSAPIFRVRAICPARRSTARRLTTRSSPTAASSTARKFPTALSGCGPLSAVGRNLTVSSLSAATITNRKSRCLKMKRKASRASASG